MLKDMLYITAGGFLTIKDRVQKELNALENRGKITKEDSKAFIDRLYERARAEHNENMEYFKEVVNELNLASKDDIARVEKKLDEILKKMKS
ncbi:hypothetical protein O6B97_05095 [Campylobacter ureolyticus]|jgi:hypothetical protein|uniref:hypothetical protein n=1 Tax=Campylobacter ureolyticus TaxID=827 RepID=UPI0022B34D46|nr:hypothetical protein [Campylobacter ureolyticus]MCZ6105562.1 hypothetical protein [Campylobacter ureolyticus]MCZ6116494.1 hypothetical protein [Campylobacter ureolyticus]MCZ6158203.1 hypothetical protein [Campylobacter ureolyticus]MCZ6186468.1 hypothetical protein [Campylobacter ureolyticus]